MLWSFERAAFLGKRFWLRGFRFLVSVMAEFQRFSLIFMNDFANASIL